MAAGIWKHDLCKKAESFFALVKQKLKGLRLLSLTAMRVEPEASHEIQYTHLCIEMLWAYRPDLLYETLNFAICSLQIEKKSLRCIYTAKYFTEILVHSWIKKCLLYASQSLNLNTQTVNVYRLNRYILIFIMQLFF